MKKNSCPTLQPNPARWFDLVAALCVAFYGLLQTACGHQYFYQERKNIPNQQWTYHDTLDFRFDIADTSKTYNLYLDFEYVDSFPTQNLYLRLHTLFPDAKRLSKQKSIELFDAYGAPVGSCSNHKCQAHILLQEHTYFDRPGPYVITLEQFTRRDSLPGLFTIGMSIDVAQAPKK